MTLRSHKSIRKENDEICLFWVLTDTQEDNLFCTMTDEPLAESLDYHALSYAWTDPYMFLDLSKSDTGELIFNAFSIQIHRNLASCSRNIRHK